MSSTTVSSSTVSSSTVATRAGAPGGGVEPLSQLLRRRTRSEHEATEERFASALHPAGTADLVALLRIWRVVWSDVADAVRAGCPQAREELAVPAGQALDWLAADLAALGEPGGPPGPAGRFTGLLGDADTTWGVAYVLRGSRLGGAVLAANARRGLGLGGEGTRYLASAGTPVGREWVAFRRRLDAWGAGSRAAHPARCDAVVDAARLTFRHVADAAGVPPHPPSPR